MGIFLLYLPLKEVQLNEKSFMCPYDFDVLHLYRILTCCNVSTLSIHIKLEMAGHFDLNRAESVPKAKEELCDFLTELDSQVKCVEVEKKPLLGVDPRRRKFVKHLIAAKNEYRLRSPFLQEKLPVVQQLLHSDAETDKQATLLLLEELRMLIEEHIGSDIDQLFGGF